jgi:methylthioribose-1-phosphate isomerase
MRNRKKTGKLLALAIVVLVTIGAMSGCQSFAGTFGIATEQYVDEKVSEAEGRLSAQVDENQKKINEYTATADKLEELIGSVEDSVKTTEELKQLAVLLEERLNDLPKETIRQLVDVLQQYLDSQQ